MGKKVLALIGHSGSGKTTLAEMLRGEGYNIIDSYTTRPKRVKNESGHTFVDMNTYMEHTIKDQFEDGQYIIAYTEFDEHRYWATKEQLKEGWNVYVIDLKGYKDLKLNSSFETVGIFVQTDRITRYSRMEEERGTIAATKRLGHDEVVFKTIPCDYAVDNNFDLENAYKEILNIMEECKYE